jgi:acyl-CoA synthetase (AMP-forming)/AMP-acid ligase II
MMGKDASFATTSPVGLERWTIPEGSAAPRNLDEFLHHSLKRFSDSVLLDYFEQGSKVTYGEFGRLVDDLTAALAGAGIGHGSHVGVMLLESPEHRALTFALARRRAVCVPINNRYTATEVDYVAGDAEIIALFVESVLVDGLGSSSAVRRLGRDRVITFGSAPSSPIGTALTDVPRVKESDGDRSPAEPTDVTHIQYTSGTTGFPKGCLLTQDYWLTAAEAMQIAGNLGTRLLDDAPYFYMAGPMWLIKAMSNGGTLVVPDRPSLRKFLGWLHDQRIDYSWFPGEILASAPSDLDRGHRLRHGLVYNLSPEKVAQIEERFGVVGRDLWAMTETGIGTFVPWDAPEIQAAGSVGVPMPFREFRIVDENMQEVPPDQPGELCVRGRGMFAGYHKRPDANAELISPDGWFRTGDRARRNAQGWIFFLGRSKDMVRRSGENISSVEVEHVLRQLPNVVTAAVVPVPDPHRGEEVKAYLLVGPQESHETLPTQQVFDWCAINLARFKIPRYLEYRRDLPETPSGKVDKRALIAEKEDLRQDSYDRVDDMWR